MNSTLMRCSRRWRKYLEHKMDSEPFGSQPRQHTALQLCKLESLAFTDGHERPLIHECEHAAHGNAWYIRLLVEAARFEPNARDDDGFTPLMAAAEFGHIEVLKLLVEHNADVSATRVREKKHDEISALHQAVKDGHAQCAAFLYGKSERALAVPARRDKDQRDTPVGIAAFKGHLDCLRVLCDGVPDTRLGAAADGHVEPRRE